MSKFETLLVKEVRQETADCVSIAFDVPETAASAFAFKQGQYITIKTSINGEEIRRSYSICSSPLDNELRVAVKKVSGGIFSTWANEKLKAGAMLEVMPPMGKFFTALDSNAKKQYVAFASGSGITPILSIIKTTLLTEPLSHFTLVYGNRNRHSIIFKEALESPKNKFMGRFSIVYILSREKTDAPIHFGRIDDEKFQQLCNNILKPATIDEYFLCGPEEMIFSVKKALEESGVDNKKSILNYLLQELRLKKLAIRKQVTSKKLKVISLLNKTG